MLAWIGDWIEGLLASIVKVFPLVLNKFEFLEFSRRNGNTPLIETLGATWPCSGRAGFT